MAIIHLPQGKSTIVDDSDYEWLNQWRWRISFGGGRGKTRPYVARNFRIDGKDQHTFMHRLLTSAPPDLMVDHINGNGLDNQRSNLRLVTREQNMRNRRSTNSSSSQYVGVSWIRRIKRWQAQIRVQGKVVNLGSYIDEETAARVRDDAARTHYGEYAFLNFPEVT